MRPRSLVHAAVAQCMVAPCFRPVRCEGVVAWGGLSDEANAGAWILEAWAGGHKVTFGDFLYYGGGAS